MISLEAFKNGIQLLADMYGEIPESMKKPTAIEAWKECIDREFNCDDRFIRAIKVFIQLSPYMPRVPADFIKVWRDSGECRDPGENWQRHRLASSESAASDRVNREIKSLTPEQMQENVKRISLIYKIACNWKRIDPEEKQAKMQHLSGLPVSELEAIASTCITSKRMQQVARLDYSTDRLIPPEKAILDDMKKYLVCGSQRYRQMAIDWAVENQYILVKNDQGQVVDVAEPKKLGGS